MKTGRSNVVFGDTKTDFSPDIKGPMDFDIIGYEMAFRQWLREADDFRAFKLRIAQELEHLGFTDWAYMRLDTPPCIAFKGLVGTFSISKFQSYIDKKLYNDDYVFRKARSDSSITLMTDIESHIETAPIKTPEMVRNEEIITIYKKNFFNEYLAVPIFTGKQENHAVFILTAKGLSPDTFKKNVSTQSRKIHIIIKLAETVGIEKYTSDLLGAKQKYEKLANLRSMQLLKLMADKDLNISQASDAMHMSRTAADKQLASIRDKLDTGTTHGALLKAIRLGFIEI